MNKPLMKYNGYALYEWGHGYKSEIDGKWYTFCTADQWVKLIKERDNGKNKKARNSD